MILYCILNQKFDLNNEDQETLHVILTGEGTLFQISLHDIDNLRYLLGRRNRVRLQYP